MSDAATITTPTDPRPTAAAALDLEVLATPAAGVPALDRLAMRIGLALLLWGRHHADRRSDVRPYEPFERAALVGDARWYMR